MWSIKWREKVAGKSQWRYAVHEQNPNKGQKCKFPSRRKAMQWLRNGRNRWKVEFPAYLMHEGKVEKVEGIGEKP